MSWSEVSGGQLAELAAFALEYAGDAPVAGAGAGAGTGAGAGVRDVFLFADDIADRYLYTFADLAEAREHLADPTHCYLRCALAWRPGPDVLAVQAQEIGSSTSFTLTWRRLPEGPAGEVVRTEGTRAVLPPSGTAAKTKADPEPEPGDPADPTESADLAELEGALERAVDSGEGLVKAEDRLRRWAGPGGEEGWEAAERWLRSRFPIEDAYEGGYEDAYDPADDASPEGASESSLGGVRTPGRYVITFREGDAPTPTGPVAALAAWDRVAREAREVLGLSVGAPDETAVAHPVTGVRLALDRTSGRYEVSLPLTGDTVPPTVALEQLCQLALSVQLETGLRAVDPQAGLYVDQLGGAKWARRLSLFARAVRSFRPGPS
ncbi:hypothetical protein [Streptomyces antarcticus]|uniref:hypothetical protein n=1 Tax=Streptomyces antarcticus TaxID=2996458 RepID=UPI002270CDB9|nr:MULTISPECIES: hypothetical protein [unclassified Streptomyces]MCY0945765.1 hypothetical protein [Streptomyces sp. H34-AA3]MCZ4084073.1 hypothetical protein [Streptomyces sp. H34-S5]